MKEFKGAKSSERGQAATEYILILLIVMIIALGALYQFNTAFANFAQNYFGNYLACLLETGELPNLGAAQGTTCDSEYEEFSLENGRRKRLAPNPTPTQSAPPAEEESEPEEAARQGQNRTIRGRGGGSRSRGPTRLSTASAPGESEEESNAQRSISDPGSGGSRSRARTFSSSRTGPRKISSNIAAPVREERPQVKTAKTTVSEEGEARKKKIPVQRLRKKAKVQEDEPFTFSKFIRYLLIAGIIIAIVVFLGGQILQFSKGDDG